MIHQALALGGPLLPCEAILFSARLRLPASHLSMLEDGGPGQCPGVDANGLEAPAGWVRQGMSPITGDVGDRGDQGDVGCPGVLKAQAAPVTARRRALTATSVNF
eukprot:Skav225597  [mRNA]  locus=scaffold1399:67020:67334:- [translate_table: standard]